MDAEARRVFFTNVHDLWIAPELQRRRDSGGLPPDFKVYRALICFPKDAPPQLTFNDEISWLARMDLPDPRGLRLGDPVYWDQVRRIESVDPPTIDNARVAFVYLFKATKGYRFIFDFSPNLPEGQRTTLALPDWDHTFGPAIAETLHSGLVERTINVDDAVQSQLSLLGLWPAPALVPYPFQLMLRHVSQGDGTRARAILVEHCNPAFLLRLAESWWTAPEFAQRRTLLTEALGAHGERRYVLSIPALLPQLEGVVTDWMYRSLSDSDIPFRQESKTRHYRDALLKTPDLSFAYRRLVDATFTFVLEGPVLSSFKRWNDVVDATFPHRHVVEHGRHDEALYTEENSVKLVLLLDTLHFMMTSRTL